jgi:hypothetical protein
MIISCSYYCSQICCNCIGISFRCAHELVIYFASGPLLCTVRTAHSVIQSIFAKMCHKCLHRAQCKVHSAHSQVHSIFANTCYEYLLFREETRRPN